LLAIVHIDPAEHLSATHAPAVFTARIGYDRVHRRGRRCTAWALNQRHPADFDFVHFLFSCLCLYNRIFPRLTEGGDGRNVIFLRS
jgi:hypothetical protein